MIWTHKRHTTHRPIELYIHTCLLLISMLWHRQAIFESKGDKLSSSAECRIRTQGLRHQILSRLNARWQTDWAIEDQAKTWSLQPIHTYILQCYSCSYRILACVEVLAPFPFHKKIIIVAKIAEGRAFLSWALIHGSSWYDFMKAEPDR